MNEPVNVAQAFRSAGVFDRMPVMSFLYRVAVAVTRKQPYIDWANSFDDGGPELTADLADGRRTIYLVPESDEEPDRKGILVEFWQEIFEEELAGWMQEEEDWPSPLTREMFDAWFEVEVTDSVFDLTPEEPLTQADVEAEDLAYAVQRCAWCDIEVDEGTVRVVSFGLPDRTRLAHREGLTLPLIIDDERVVIGIMSRPDSVKARAGEDLLFRACTSRCEKAIRKTVPKALRKLLQDV
jgi:hypothetical protein